jgi:hypothetical protein
VTAFLPPAELLDLVIEKAEALRRVGVLELELAGCSLKLAPFEAEAPASTEEPAHVGHVDPLSDPRTFGLHGQVPGFERLHQQDGES